MRALRIATGLPKSYSPQALIILYTTKINHARRNQRFPLYCGWNATVRTPRKSRSPIGALIALITGLCFAAVGAAVAATDYSCVQACVSHGSLYQDCVGRCTSVTPGAPQNAPAPAAVAPTPSLPAVAPQTVPIAPPVAPVRPAIEAPSVAPLPPTPTQQNVNAPRKAPATAVRPPPIVNGNCLAHCKDRGQLYDYCLKLCSTP